MKKVIVTGATGFIGYHLVKKLLQEKVEVWVICRENSVDCKQLKKIKGVHVVKCDLNNLSLLTKYVQERNFDVFYHLAWHGASGELRTDYEVQIDNIKWTCSCVKMAYELKCKKIVVTGTICEKQCDAIVTSQEYSKSGYYLFAKKTAYNMCCNLSKQYNIPLIWCRFYHPIGVYNKKEQLIINSICKMLRKEPLKFGTGEGLFDVVDVRDLASALYIMGDRELQKTEYFVGSGYSRKLREYLEELKVLLDTDAQMQYKAFEFCELPMEAEWLDMTAFQMETGFLPQYSYAESILDILKWLRNEEQYRIDKWNF